MSKNAVCIIEGKEIKNKKYYPIESDVVLETIKNIKKKLNIYKGTKLAVCEEHLEELQKRRKNFERTALIFSSLYAILLFLYILNTIANISAERIISFITFFISLTIAISALIILSYAPKPSTENNKKEKKNKKKKQK